MERKDKKLNKQLLEKIKKRLLEEKREIERWIEESKESFQVNLDVGDEADMAAIDATQEAHLQAVDTKRGQLKEIMHALEKIEDGTYGYCENCNCKLPVNRIKALPTARYCIKCQQVMERSR